MNYDELPTSTLIALRARPTSIPGFMNTLSEIRKLKEIHPLDRTPYDWGFDDIGWEE